MLLEKSEQQTIRSLFIATRQLYNTIQYTNENITDYLVRFRNTRKVDDACDGSLISRVVHEHGMSILYTLHVTSFDVILYYNKK